jgi:hypothetical protein
MSDPTQPTGTPHTDTTGTGPVAVLLTADRFLAAYLTDLHPGLAAVTATTDPLAYGLVTPVADGVLPVGDGLLVLADTTTSRTVYVSGDLDDAGIWARAAVLGAVFVAVLPDGEPWLRTQLTDLLGEPSGTP